MVCCIYSVKKALLFLFFASVFESTKSKWVEGHVKTSRNWVFLARFCFLSYDGQFEYHIEFNHDLGVPNLLLYYDDETQWPSVYHSNKTCHEREEVLNKLGQNQIIPLSSWYPENDFSGCVMRAVDDSSQKTSNATSKTEMNFATNKTKASLPDLTKFMKTNNVTQDPTYFDKFLKTTVAYSEVSTDNTTESNYSQSEFDESDVEILDDLLITEPSLSENNINDTDLLSNLKDVETFITLPQNYMKNGNMKIIKRDLRQYDRNKVKKFNLSPPRPPHDLLTSGKSRSKYIISCHNMRRFRSVRERWWFIAISNCNENKGLDVKYKFLMTNGPPGDYWHEHFSADEFYVLPILMAFCFAYVLMIMAIVICSVELKSRQMLHTTYKLFVSSVCFQQTGILLQSLAYVKYAVNGVGSNATKICGEFLCGISEIKYLLLLILMAKGYTITRARLKLSFTVKLTVFICVYSITYMSLFIYQAKEFDPGEVLYLYESPVGYCLIVLKICAWFMFIYALVFTIKKYPEKGVFYYPFSLCGTMWFYAGPLFILSANNYIDKWVRESVVIAVLLFISFSGHISFLLLTLPVFANKNFPYHVRTTQIGIMQVTGMIAGNSTMDSFGHNIYMTNTGLAPSVIIPLSRRTEELIGSFTPQIPSAPPLGLMDTYNHNVFRIKEPPISQISNNAIDLLTINNIGPKLSISTQHSTESATSDKFANNRENHLDSLENRFVPQSNEDMKKMENSSHSITDKLLQNDDQLSNESTIIDTDNSSYKNDPSYIKDINNPFLVQANRARKGILEPIKRDSFNVMPPIWSIAKSQTNKNKSNKLAKNNNEDYNLQGVIGTFPLPHIPKKTEQKIFDREDSISKETESIIVSDDSPGGGSLNILQQPEEKLDDTTLALFSVDKVNS